jgi:importin-7
MVMDWGEDYLETAVGPLENFITFGSDTFVSSEAPNYRQSLWAMLQHHFNDADAEQTEVKFLAKLMDVALLNCRGRMDEWLWPYLQLSLQRLQAATNAGFATLLMNVLPSALLYNAQATLAVLEAHDKTRPVRSQAHTCQMHHASLHANASSVHVTCACIQCWRPCVSMHRCT